MIASHLEIFNFFNISFRLMEKDHQIEAICAYQHPNLSNKLKKYVNLKMNLFILGDGEL